MGEPAHLNKSDSGATRTASVLCFPKVQFHNGTCPRAELERPFINIDVSGLCFMLRRAIFKVRFSCEHELDFQIF
jgi:hypothetical protein